MSPYSGASKMALIRHPRKLVRPGQWVLAQVPQHLRDSSYSFENHDKVYICVRREKARIFSGCKSRPATLVAPAGSNRSGGGGNETAGAFDVKGRLGDSASRQAVTRVNAEQAPKGLTWEPTRRRNVEGRRHWETGGHTPRSDSNQWSHRGIGDGMSAEEIRRNTGSPERWRRVTSNRTPARERPGWPG